MALEKILIVEDDPGVMLLLMNILKRHGYNATGVVNGRTAIEQVGLYEPDMLLLDISLPDINGYDICRQIKSSGNNVNIPVIFISGMGDSTNKTMAFDAGGVDFINKPFDEAEVVLRVRTHLSLYNLQRDLEERVRARTIELMLSNEHLREEISERIKVERALGLSEKRYRRLVESVTNYIYTVTFEGGTPISTYHGPGCITVTGYSSEEYNADPGLWYKMVHEEDRRLVTDHTKEIIENKETRTIEHRIIHKNGSVRWIRNTPVIRKDEYGNIAAYDGMITDITEKKAAEMALQESEEKFRKLFNTMMEGVAIHRIIRDEEGKPIDYIVLETNPSYSVHTGIKCENAVGVRASLLYKKTIPPYLDLYEKVVETKMPVRFEAFFEPMNRHYNISAFSPFQDIFVTVFEDISIRKHAELAMKKREELFRNTFEQAAVGIGHISPDGKFIRLNNRFCGILGYEREELLKMSFYDITGKNDVPIFQMLTGLIDETKRIKDLITRQYIRKDCSTVWVNLTVSLVRTNSGKPKYFIVVIEDISEMKKNEEEILRLNRHIMRIQEDERQKVAKDLHDSVGQTILAAKLNIEAFRKNPENNVKRLEMGLRFIDKASQELREVYSDLYPSILNDLGLEATIGWYSKHVLESNGVSVQSNLSLPGKLSHRLEVNLYRIIQEIFANILKHSKCSVVDIELFVDGKDVILIVTDDGVGFDPGNNMKCVIGQGLSNIRTRTESFGGAFMIDTAPGKGTRIIVRIMEEKANEKN